MLAIRLVRKGRRNTATFRLILQEKSQSPHSKSKEILGTYNPHIEKREEQISLNKERIKYWLSVGAQPSNTVHNMLVEFGVITGKKKRSVQPDIKKKEGEGGSDDSAASSSGAPAKTAEGGETPAKADAKEEKKADTPKKAEEKSEEKKDDSKAENKKAE